MRRSILYLLALLALSVSCRNLAETEAPSGNPEEQVAAGQAIIRATLEQEFSSKTALNENMKVVWCSGDQIKVFNKENPSGVVYTLLESSAGTTLGKFSGDALSGTGPYYAMYPASAAGTLSGSVISLDLPGTQQYAQSSFGNGSCVSVGSSETTGIMDFYNVLGCVSFSLESPKALSGIRVSTRGSEALYGTGSVTVSETPALSLNGQSGTNGSLYLDCSAAGTVQSFYLMVPPGSLGSGFIVEFLDTEGKVMLKTASSNRNTVERSVILSMPVFPFTAEYKGAFMQADAPGYYGHLGAEDASPLAVYAFDEENGQYSYRTTSSSRFVRIQNMVEGFAYGFTTPYNLVVGETYDVTREVNGIPDAETRKYILVRKSNDAAWFLAQDRSEGFIQMLVED